MPNYRQLASALAAAVALAATAEAAEPLFAPNVTGFALGNGLEVVVIPDHRSPVVTHMVWYKVGSADDPLGKSGLAHFLEHLMFKGTADTPAGAFSARVAALGGNDNAFTTPDATAYHQTVARQHLGLMMEFEADRMVNLEITEEAMLSERQVIIQERRQSVDNRPNSRLGEMVRSTLFQNSRYGIPTLGWEHELVALDNGDALALYRTYYTPNNAVVVVAGDVTEEDVRALAVATYGRLPRGPDLPPRVRLVEPEPAAARTVSLSDPRVTEPSFSRVYLVPSGGSGEPGEAEALSVLAEILGGSSTSRFYRRLIIDEAIATGARAGYSGAFLGSGTFSVGGSPRGTATLAELEQAMDGVIADLLLNGVTEEELLRAKRGVRAAVIYAQDNPSSLARVFGAALVRGDTIADVQQSPERLAAVTVDDVNAVARKYLTAQRSVTSYLLTAPERSGS